MDDWDFEYLIKPSYLKEYHEKLTPKNMEQIPWGEFLANVSALGFSENALSKMVWIRTETDDDIISSWTPEARKINSEWRNKQALNMSDTDAMEAAKLAQAFFDGLKVKG